MLRRIGTCSLAAGAVELAAGLVAFLVHGFRIGLGSINIAVDPSVTTVVVAAVLMVAGTACLRLARTRDEGVRSVS